MGSDRPHPGEHVPLDTLKEWAESTDPSLHYLAFHTAFAHPDTVQGLDERRRLAICIGFLEAALAGAYADTLPDGPYVFAHTVLSWLRQLARTDQPRDARALRAVLEMLERLARSGDPATREVIILGVLEHALEEPRTAELFRHWNDDPILEPLYREALRLSS